MWAAGSVVTRSVRRPRLCEPDRGRARDDRLSDTALAREEDRPRSTGRHKGRECGGRIGGSSRGDRCRLIEPEHGSRRSSIAKERHDRAQPRDATDLAVEERHVACRQRQGAGDLAQIPLLHLDPSGVEGCRRLVRGHDAVDDQLTRGNAELRELCARAPRLGQSRALGLEHEDEMRPAPIAQRAKSALVLCLRISDCRGRADARLAGASRGLGDAPGPGLRQLEQADGVPGRRRVEDDEIERRGSAGRRCGVGVEEVGEPVERGNLGRTRSGELLLHDLDDLGREDLSDRRERSVGVLRGRLVRVDLHRPEALDADNRRDDMADRLLKGVGEVGRGIGRDDEHRPPGVGLGDGGRTGHRGLAHAPLA